MAARATRDGHREVDALATGDRTRYLMGVRVPFVNLARLHEPIRDAVDQAIASVIDSDRFVGGPVVQRFEERFAARVGARWAIAVSSGTDAILASLMALDLRPGDEVITTPFTFASAAQAVTRLGGTPVFVDVDPETLNLDPARLTDAVSDRTVGVLPVHLYGNVAGIRDMKRVADAHGLWIVEDAAQAIGARDDSRHAGTFGATGCFSFFPTKTLGALGDGGMIVTDDDDLASELRRVRHHGAEPKYHHHRLGGNFRLDALQAAVLDVKLDLLDDWLDRRRVNASTYDARLPDGVRPPFTPGHAWHQYVIRHPRRDTIAAALAERGVETMVYYPTTLDRQPCFADVARVVGPLDHAHRAADEVLALPVGPGLTEDERDWVVRSLLDALE